MARTVGTLLTILLILGPFSPAAGDGQLRPSVDSVGWESSKSDLRGSCYLGASDARDGDEVILVKDCDCVTRCAAAHAAAVAACAYVPLAYPVCVVAAATSFGQCRDGCPNQAEGARDC